MGTMKWKNVPVTAGGDGEQEIQRIILGSVGSVGGQAVSPLTGSHHELAKVINTIIDNDTRHLPGLRWERMEIIRANKEAIKQELDERGTCFALVTFVHNKNGDKNSAGKNDDFAKDGSSYFSKHIVAGICKGLVDCVGVGDDHIGVLVAVPFMKGSSNLDNTNRDRLQMLGFRTAAPARTLVQTCCEPDNVLNQPRITNVDMRMVNVTREDDFTSAAGIAKAKRGIRGPCDVLWNSSPCTGGSAIQQLNIAQWGERALKKIAEHYKLFRKLWCLRGGGRTRHRSGSGSRGRMAALLPLLGR